MMGEKNQLVLLEHDSHVVTITLNNPPANVLSQAVTEQLSLAFQDMEQMDLDAVIITGQGNHSFCAGADIKELAKNDLTQNKAHFAMIYNTFNLIAACKYPVIAAINGYAYGAGLELTLCADIRVMDKNARICPAGVNLNLSFGTQRLVRLVGPGRARNMLFSARQITAAESLECGLVEHIAAPGTSWDTARDIAMLIGPKGRMAVQGMKQLLNQGIELPLPQALELEAESVYRLLATSEFACRVKKFLMK